MMNSETLAAVEPGGGAGGIERASADRMGRGSGL